MKMSTIPASTIMVEAQYRKSGITRYDGNPFIEALTPFPKEESDFSPAMEYSPLEPTDATRRKSAIVRKMEVLTINDLVYPFTKFDKAGRILATMIREAYVARNPMTTLDVQRRHAIATCGGGVALRLPSNWKPSAKGCVITAVSGMGKTTLVSSFLLLYPQVIRHKSYHKQPLRCHQVVYLVLRTPHDGTLRSLCLQFVEQIDELLGTDYAREARGVRNIAPMVDVMNKAATAVSLGLVVFDEVQNLRSASGQNAEHVLNLFTAMIERLGISVVTMATPAIDKILGDNVCSLRKLTSAGLTILPPMKENDDEWNQFCDACWAYTFTKNKPVLSDKVRHTWYQVSAGNTAFATLAFMLSQQNEIGGREIVDEDAFERTAAQDMAFLQPAIAALHSRDPERLKKFDDLVFSPRFRELLRSMGIDPGEDEKADADEFEELKNIPNRPMAKKHASSKASLGQHKVDWDEELPTEDPLAR
jgi:AAA domain